MRCALVVAAAVATSFGCATSRQLPMTGDGHSELSGVIPIPDDFDGAPADFCAQVEVRATTSNGMRVGHVLMQPAATHCSYSLEDVPPGTAVTVSVLRSPVLRCLGGQKLSINPDSVPLTLDKQARVANFNVICTG